ncbi:cytochrome P450 [Streptomyces sp. Go40/10]|uniref:cytochrome P450 n=1 Tax=Streptomyces sp. Go40/10 TaxID=2825844 RepID=UPI001E287A0E|nr:cytochrome P450 [Streptomyces sp. Go40/10]UFR07144.1 cytochrome P450 [Streptomyces sp. Go40/10]
MAESIVSEALADLDAETGVVDLVQAYALRIPAQVIVRLLGVPEAVLPAFQGAAGVLFDTAASPAEVDQATRALLDLLGQMVDSKRRRPGDDLVSDLVRLRMHPATPCPIRNCAIS